MTCPPVNLSLLYIAAYSEAGLSVEKLVCDTALEDDDSAFCLSSERVEPTICLTLPA